MDNSKELLKQAFNLKVPDTLVSLVKKLADISAKANTNMPFIDSKLFRAGFGKGMDKAQSAVDSAQRIFDDFSAYNKGTKDPKVLSTLEAVKKSLVDAQKNLRHTELIDTHMRIPKALGAGLIMRTPVELLMLQLRNRKNR